MMKLQHLFPKPPAHLENHLLESAKTPRRASGFVERSAPYFLSCTVSGLFLVMLAGLAGANLATTPLRFMLVTLVTVLVSALALSTCCGAASDGERSSSPRGVSVPDPPHGFRVGLYCGAVTLTVIATFGAAWIGLSMSLERALTSALLTLAFAHLWNVFNMHDSAMSLVVNDVTLNPWIWAALGLGILILLGATYAPAMQAVLGTVDPGLDGWALVMGGSILPLLIGQIAGLLQSRTTPTTTTSWSRSDAQR
ncbi:MAG: cation transporting ATPase C-terminal domain-containing protein [Chloroflexi bacterium]|nr:cation transporting ATPase C-terminal domain-containing protein [Chloroflexota bacterium]